MIRSKLCCFPGGIESWRLATVFRFWIDKYYNLSKRYGLQESGKDVNSLLEAIYGFASTIEPVSIPLYTL